MSEQEKNNLEETQPAEKATQDTAPEKKEKAPKKVEKRPNFFVRAVRGIAKWVKDLRGEAKKVIWPTGKQTFKSTCVVIAAVIVIAIFVYILDVTFGFLRDMIVQLV